MREECQKYGSVLSLLIPKENPGKGQVKSVGSSLKQKQNNNNNWAGGCVKGKRGVFSVFAMKPWHEAVISCSQVFVEYANAGDSKEAQRLLTGRTFDGRFVVATFYPLSAYKRGYLYQTVQWGGSLTFRKHIYTCTPSAPGWRVVRLVITHYYKHHG